MIFTSVSKARRVNQLTCSFPTSRPCPNHCVCYGEKISNAINRSSFFFLTDLIHSSYFCSFYQVPFLSFFLSFFFLSFFAELLPDFNRMHNKTLLCAWYLVYTASKIRSFQFYNILFETTATQITYTHSIHKNQKHAHARTYMHW